MSALFWEKFWPYIMAVVVTCAWLFLAGGVFPTNIDNLMTATGTASAVLVGFLATAKAIVLGLTNSPVFLAIKAANYHRVLFQYFFEAIAIGTGLLLASVLGFFFSSHTAPLWFSIVWVFVATSAMFTYGRVVCVLFRLIEKA